MSKKKDDVFITSEVFSVFQWNDNKGKRRRLSANLLNQNGFIIFLQKMNDKDRFNNFINFYCRQDDMPILATVMDLAIGDIKNDDFTKERIMKGNKTNFHILTKKDGDKIYIGIKLVQNKDGKPTSKSETILFDTRKTEGVSHGLIDLEAFKESILKTFYRESSTYDHHYTKYFKAIEETKSKGGNGSNNNYKEDDAFPFD